MHISIYSPGNACTSLQPHPLFLESILNKQCFLLRLSTYPTILPPLFKAKTKAALADVEKEIADVSDDIKKVGEQLDKAIEEGNAAMILYFQNKEIQQREKENKLREKENKLRDEKKMLMERMMPQEKQPGRQSTRDGEYCIPDILALPRGPSERRASLTLI
jgi:hypothetical protein